MDVPGRSKDLRLVRLLSFSSIAVLVIERHVPRRRDDHALVVAVAGHEQVPALDDVLQSSQFGAVVGVGPFRPEATSIRSCGVDFERKLRVTPRQHVGSGAVAAAAVRGPVAAAAHAR